LTTIIPEAVARLWKVFTLACIRRLPDKGSRPSLSQRWTNCKKTL